MYNRRVPGGEITVGGPLDGLRVLELGSLIAGPFAGQLLGDYGADVVKVEPPGMGDPMRRWGVTKDGQSLWWPSIARNKRSVTIDLRQEEGQELVRRLAPSFDIVIENFRPGTMQAWGLGYDAFHARNRGIVLVHVSGFGQTGPYAAQAGFGSVAEAVGGIRFTTGDPDRQPARTGISLGDSLAALFTVVGSLAAINERHRSGQGQEVDVAIYEAVLALMESSIADLEVGGVLRERSGPVLPGVAPSNAYPTADRQAVVIAANADAVFSRLAVAMNRPDLVDDPRFATHEARGRHMDVLDGLISEWSGELPSEELLGRLHKHRVPVARINTAADILRDVHVAARDMVVRHRMPDGWEVPMNGIVPKFERTPGRVRAVGPALGEHNVEVLTELAGVTPSQLEGLRARGVV